jgi:prepilin-type N-terminal cleavage/methylation domain-containing protein
MPTFRVKIKSLKSRSGMTLLEIVIVVAIIAIVATFGFSRLNTNKARMQASMRKLGTLIRDVKYRAKLEGATFRIVIEIPATEPETEEEEELKSQYWVEKAPGTVLVGEDKEKSLKDIKEEDEDAPPDPNAFQPDPRALKKPEELADGLRFVSVETANREEPVIQGHAYIYFLPQGYVDEVAIQLETADKVAWTLATRPLTGKVDVFAEKKSLEDLRSD